MPTLIYDPTVRLVIDSAMLGLVDVSEDISGGSMTLRENGLHSFQVTLINTKRKYDGIFAPNDRIVVYMKRVKEMPVMSGYLNTVPLFSQYPRSIQLTASCTGKRLQYTFWDPGTFASVQLLNEGFLGGDAQKESDSGIKTKVTKILTDVVKWDQEKIHIGAIPMDWFNKVAGLARVVTEAIGPLQLGVGTASTIAGNNAQGLVSVTGIGPGTGQLRDSSGIATTTGPNYAWPEHIASSRRLNPMPAESAFYCAISGPWANRDGSPITWAGGSAEYNAIINWWNGRHLLVTNTNTNKTVCVAVHDFETASGVGSATHVIDLDPGAFEALGVNLGAGVQPVEIRFASDVPAGIPEVPLGPVNVGSNPATVRDPIKRGSASSVFGNTPLNPDLTGSNTLAQFVALALEQEGDNYVFGTPARNDLNLNNPSTFDCSGLVNWAYTQASGHTDCPGGAGDQYGWCANAGTAANPRGWADNRGLQIFGALLFGPYKPSDGPPNRWGIGHVAISLGNGWTIEAVGHSYGVKRWKPPSWDTWVYTGLIPGFDYGSLTTQQQQVILDNVHGTSVNESQGTKDGPGATAVANSAGSNQGLSPFNTYQTGVQTDPTSLLYRGLRALANDEPVIGVIQQLIAASMRSWCSAPNGDFIAWFPDYFGQYNLSGKLKLQDIELLEDFTIDWDDGPLRTHFFISGPVTTTASGAGIGGTSPVPQELLVSSGVVSVEFPEVMDALFGITYGSKRSDILNVFTDANKLLQRFGARPLKEDVPFLAIQEAEFWYAVREFQLNWASQFSTNIPMTFMPEVYPGMLLQVPSVGMQAYVTSVTHNFDYQGGFTTTANVIAPSKMDGTGLDGLLKGIVR